MNEWTALYKFAYITKKDLIFSTSWLRPTFHKEPTTFSNSRNTLQLRWRTSYGSTLLFEKTAVIMFTRSPSHITLASLYCDWTRSWYQNENNDNLRLRKNMHRVMKPTVHANFTNKPAEQVMRKRWLTQLKAWLWCNKNLFHVQSWRMKLRVWLGRVFTKKAPL